jgi:hypothetical protein
MKRYKAYIIWMMIVLCGALLASCDNHDESISYSPVDVTYSGKFTRINDVVVMRNVDSTLYERVEKQGEYRYYRSK